MSSSGPSITDRPARRSSACKALAVLSAALLAASCNRSGSDPSGPGDGGGKPYITVTSEIPEAVFAGTLRIEGTARAGDTVKARFPGQSIAVVAGAEGFVLDLPLQPSGPSTLSLFAKGRGPETSDTLRFSLVAPGIQPANFVSSKHTKKDTFNLQLRVKEFDSLRIKVNGEGRTVPVLGEYPVVPVSLAKNAPNRIVARGLWDGEEVGDSVTVELIHDNIPPRLSGQSIYLKLPARTDSTVTFRFEDSIWVGSLFLGGNRQQSNPSYAVDKNGRRLHLNIWIAMGEILPITLKVNDAAGNLLDTTFDLPTYKRKIDLNAPVWSALPSHRPDLHYVLATGGGIYVLDTKAWAVVDSIPLPATIGEEGQRRLVVNPGNKFIYVIMPRDKRVAIIDPFKKAEIGSLPLTVPIHATDVGLAFFEDGTGLYFVDHGLEGMFSLGGANGDSLSPNTLFKIANFTEKVRVHSYHGNRHILAARGHATFEYFTVARGDTSATKVPFSGSDRVVQVGAASPYSDILMLTDKRLIDSRGKALGNSLFDREFLFGKDAAGRDYMLRATEDKLELDRFATTGLKALRCRPGGGLHCIPGTNDLLVLGYKHLVILDLGEFDSP